MPDIVDVTCDDSVRIQTREGVTLQIPIYMIVAVDRVLRATIDRDDLEIMPVEDDDTGEVGFEAHIGGVYHGDGPRKGYGVTPWGAIVGLAYELEKATR